MQKTLGEIPLIHLAQYTPPLGLAGTLHVDLTRGVVPCALLRDITMHDLMTSRSWVLPEVRVEVMTSLDDAVGSASRLRWNDWDWSRTGPDPFLNLSERRRESVSD
jgi:hypothetical protein